MKNAFYFNPEATYTLTTLSCKLWLPAHRPGGDSRRANSAINSNTSSTAINALITRPLVRFAFISESKITTPVLVRLEDSVVRSDTPVSFSGPSVHRLELRARAERITQLFRRSLQPLIGQNGQRCQISFSVSQLDLAAPDRGILSLSNFHKVSRAEGPKRTDEAGLPRDAIRSQCSTCSRHNEKETGYEKD
jgi:hypothetical protein